VGVVSADVSATAELRAVVVVGVEEEDPPRVDMAELRFINVLVP